MCRVQVLQGTKAVWFLGGRLDQVQAVYSSNAFKTTSAVHFPLDVWKQQYVSRLQVETKATDKQPSSLFVGKTTGRVVQMKLSR